MFTMPRRGIVNVKMVITEEKILSNIDKVEKLINPNAKKQIIELDDNSFFKDLVESIKTYLVEYPKKKNFPKNIYDAAYELVEYATNQFEENTKQIEKLIKQREYNIKSATMLKQSLAIVQNRDENWKRIIEDIAYQTSDDIMEAFSIIGNAEDQNSEEYQAAVKLVNARIANLESNLHIEIDMERVEDRSKALSYIGIEIADALKLIPAPMPASGAENKPAESVIKTIGDPIQNVQPQKINKVQQQPVQTRNNVTPVKNNTVMSDNTTANKNVNDNLYQEYCADTRTEVKQSLWSKIKNSKFIQTIKYALRVKVVLQLPQGSKETKH